MKTLRKVGLYLLLAIAVVTVALILSAVLFKDKIIREFIREANKHLNTEIKIGTIDVSAWENFPQLAIVCHDVYIEDSHRGDYPLLTAREVSFQLNPLEVYRGIYKINGLVIRDSETTLKINQKGENNFTITRPTQDTTDTAIGFELRKISLINTRVHYRDQPANQEYTFYSNNLAASIQSTTNVYTINTSGDVTTELIRIHSQSFLQEKLFTVAANLEYNDDAKSLTIKPSTLDVHAAAFSVEGDYTWKEKPYLNLKATGKNATIQTLVSLLPESAAARLSAYQSDGEAYFTATLKGAVTATRNPSVSVSFGLTDAELFHPDTKASLRQVSMEGSYASADISDLTQAVMVLKNVRGTLNGEPFEANLVVQNMIDSDVIVDFKGLLDARALMDFYPVATVSDVSGSLVANVSFSGKLSWLKSKATAQRATANGSVEVHDLNFRYGKDQIAVENLNGNLQFNNNDLALSNVSGKLGNSDFIMNGFFRNIITFILFDNQPIGIEADLQSRFLDLDQLFALGFGTAADKQEQYEFSISKNLYLNFNCNVESLRYKRFHAHALHGDLLVKNEMAVSRNITVKTMGGDLTLSAILDAKNPKAIDVVSSLQLMGISADSVFYVFENFDQHFIEDRHIRGKTTADVSLEMTLNQHLKLFPETLIADISATIRNGELNDFEPLQKLNKYLDDDELHHLRFADLKNDIHIEKKTVYIPQMIVQSNVTAIQISGTHTFDQQIDYRLVTPLNSKKRVNVQEAGNAIETLDGQSKLFLKIVGTTDDYRIIYDTEAVKKKIVADLRKEVKELKDAFKNKGVQKKKELELSTETFDWDN